MIHKNATVGVIQGVTLAEFGNGDIEVIAAKQIVTGFPNILLKNSEPHPIGTDHHRQEGTTTDELEAFEVCLTFSKPESIDVLIGKLQEVKEFFHSNPPGWDIAVAKLNPAQPFNPIDHEQTK
jgi:hypothetical protein